MQNIQNIAWTNNCLLIYSNIKIHTYNVLRWEVISSLLIVSICPGSIQFHTTWVTVISFTLSYTFYGPSITVIFSLLTKQCSSYTSYFFCTANPRQRDLFIAKHPSRTFCKPSLIGLLTRLLIGQFLLSCWCNVCQRSKNLGILC